MTPEQTEALRKPFAKSAIGKIPKGGAQLDYVGHAAVTDRLLAVDPQWSWEPVAFDDQGQPLISNQGKRLVMWIRLTVANVTRLGVGTCQPNAFEPEKELVGDALRNAAMRFGVALDLWSREELEYADQETPAPVVDQRETKALGKLIAEIKSLGVADQLRAAWLEAGLPNVQRLNAEQTDQALTVAAAVLDQAAQKAS